MIQVTVESLVVGMTPMPSVLTLRPSEQRTGTSDDLVLPIWIGSMEAASIVAALENAPSERPITHKLAIDLIGAMGGKVSRVVIDRVDGSTFYSTVYVRCSNGMFVRVDARPSDGIALAVRASAPVFVEEQVLELAGCPRSFTSDADTKIELEEFDKFIEQVNPEDFVTRGGNQDS